MGSFSDSYETKVLEHITGKAALAKPTAYIALYTVSPTDSTAGTEVTGGGYARIATAATDWNAAANGQITNAVDFTWPAASASWGSVVAVALVDATTGGTIIVWGAAATPKTISAGDQYKIAAGNLTISLD